MTILAQPSSRDHHGPWLVLALTITAVLTTLFYYQQGLILAYADADAHLDIAKRVVHSITPGLAQLGGIWLPLPHLLMVPLVMFEPLYRTGLAGAIVSGVAYVISGVYIYKIARLLTGSGAASLVAAAVFMLNPNVLYLQATPMTELPLIACFAVSGYYFVRWAQDDSDTIALIFAATFGFLATLMRYDGWFLVAFQGLAIAVMYSLRSWNWGKLEGKAILFATPAFFGIALWLLWGWQILGDPLYFTNSPFSAKSQQNDWAASGMLPAHNDLFVSLSYYTVTTAITAGVVIFCLGVIGALTYLLWKPSWQKLCILMVLGVPFTFNVVTLYLGQSIILIPHLAQPGFTADLFNVRYGVLMIPTVAIFIGYLFQYRNLLTRVLIIMLVAGNMALFVTGHEEVISLVDAQRGVSSQPLDDVEHFIAREYDHGLLFMEDFAQASVSILRAGIPIQNWIYIGNKPYWENALTAPQNTVRWIVLQVNSTTHSHFIDGGPREANLRQYFDEVYTSDTVLVFRRNQLPATPQLSGRN